ncbi:hypothetical protein GGS20DRAFT_98066 [Poronia punctata]|nr:hypothetical protein GGS20DRAFT_98066 [Poronia punctata]
MAFDTTTVGWLTLIVGWILTALALASVAVFICVKPGSHRVDDFMLYVSILLSLVLMVVTTWAVVAEGQGRHQPEQPRSHFELVAKSLLVNEILWGLVNSILRVGAILFIRKVFGPGRGMRPATTTLLVVSAAYGIAVVIIPLVICRPINAGWDLDIPGGRCGNEVVAYLSLEVLAALLDLAITVAPLPPLLKLKLPSRRKLPIIVLFSLGSIVFIITGLRIAALNRVNSRDFSYDRGYIGFLSLLGPLLAILCCCATATAGPLTRKIQSRSSPIPIPVWNRPLRGSRGSSQWWSSTIRRGNPRSTVVPEKDVESGLATPEPVLFKGGVASTRRSSESKDVSEASGTD